MSQFSLLNGLHFVKAINAIIALSLQKIKTGPWKVLGKNVMFTPSSSVSSGAKFMVALEKSASMVGSGISKLN